MINKYLEKNETLKKYQLKTINNTIIEIPFIEKIKQKNNFLQFIDELNNIIITIPTDKIEYYREYDERFTTTTIKKEE